MSKGDFFEGDAPVAKQIDEDENTGCGCGGKTASGAQAGPADAATVLANSACFGTLVRDNCHRCEGAGCGNNCEFRAETGSRTMETGGSRRERDWSVHVTGMGGEGKRGS